MIFTPEHIQKIVREAKTETRRIVKSGERLIWCDDDNYHHFILTPSGRVKWRVGQDYAVQPGRGKPCYIHNGMPLRCKILRLSYSESLQAISSVDAKAEGLNGFGDARLGYARLWDSINKQPGTRWNDNPMVWVIKFEVLQS
ncbi:hypothetical protein LCGC14_1446220 [marine sediment metagenome]|uniref:ASCH domain-containing protein n=1 Tax=marine sediment metagenome TaxID=412755 RepID=A0A0F9K5H6_9ZZZZ